MRKFNWFGERASARVHKRVIRSRRRLLLESLEQRLLLVSDWTNQFGALDVNRDGSVSPIDALTGINELNERRVIGSESSLPSRNGRESLPYYDVNGDSFLSPVDVLIVVNAINDGFVKPTIDLSLRQDTAAGGTTNNDLLTSNPNVRGGLSNARSKVTRLTAQVDGSERVDVTVATDGSFSFDTPLALDGTADGQHLVRMTAFQGPVILHAEELPFTLDTQAPTVETGLAGTINVRFSEFTIAFAEPISAGAFDPDSYSLVVEGGSNDGQPIAINAVEPIDENLARIQLTAPLTNQGYRFSIASSVSDIAGNVVAGATASSFIVAQPTHVTQFDPADMEEFVSPTRVTRVHFDAPIDPVTVNDDSFYLIANGERVPGTIRVSSTEEFATFLYDDPLPASTEVRVVVEGDKILGRDNLLVDGDGDGEPGGTGMAEFRTLPLTRITGTNIFGFVYDSYNKNPDGSDIPVVGATIRVDAFPQANAVTDATGMFELVDMPSPEFFVHIDGATATSAPAGAIYPSVGKPFHTVPGQRIQLNMMGTPFNIYLPPMAMGDVEGLSPTADTQVGFGPAGRAEVAAILPNIDPATWERLQVTYPAGSAIDDAGNPVTQGVVIPVPPDRLPAPLPPGQDPQLVISIQAPGATSFDVPASITFPNLDGLAPGEQSLMWGFNHAAGRWDVVGTGTVSADGQSVVSDGGVVGAPGWWFTQPGTRTCTSESPTQPVTIEVEPIPFLEETGVSRGGGAMSVASATSPVARAAAAGVPEFSDHLFVSDEQAFRWIFRNNAPKPPSNESSFSRGCRAVSEFFKPTAMRVEIQFDGPVNDFLQDVSGKPYAGTDIVKELRPQEEATFVFQARTLANEVRELGDSSDPRNVLFGAQINVTVSGGSLDSIEKTQYVYRYLDVTDPDHGDGRIEFEDTVADGTAGVVRGKKLELRTSASALPELRIGSEQNFRKVASAAPNVRHLVFDPVTFVKDNPSTSEDERVRTEFLHVARPSGGAPIESLVLSGQAAPVTTIYVNTAGLGEVLDKLSRNPLDASIGNAVRHPLLLTFEEQVMLAAERQQILNGVLEGLTTRFREDLGASAPIIVTDTVPQDQPYIELTWAIGSSPTALPGQIELGVAEIDPNLMLTRGGDNFTELVDLFRTERDQLAANKIPSRVVRNFNLSRVLNQFPDAEPHVFVQAVLEAPGSNFPLNLNRDQMIELLVRNAAHETAHTLGAVHTALYETYDDTPEAQGVFIVGAAAGDTYRLKFGESETDPFPAIVSTQGDLDVIENALRAFPNLGLNVSVSFDLAPAHGATYSVFFVNDLAGIDVPDLVATPVTSHGPDFTVVARQTRMAEYKQRVKPGKEFGSLGKLDIMVQNRAELGLDLKFQPSVSREILLLGLKGAWGAEEAARARSVLHANLVKDGPYSVIGDIPGTPVNEGPVLFILDDDGLEVVSQLDLGTVATDGTGGAAGAVTLRLINSGTEDLVLQSVAISDPSGTFRVIAPANGTNLAPGAEVALPLTFDPTRSGSYSGQLHIRTNQTVPETVIDLTGFGQSPNGDLELGVRSNNVGGVGLGEAPREVVGFATVENLGAQALTITDVRFAEDVGQFLVSGLPAGFGPGKPLVLQPGDSQTVGVTFDAKNLGLQRAVLEFVSNDPQTPLFRQSVIGTGLADFESALDWGNDFVVLDQGGPVVQRARSTTTGEFDFVLRPNTGYELTIFDPVSGLVSHNVGTSASSGQPTNLGRFTFVASSAPDTDGDGLPDDAEFAIGTAVANADTDGDGISDFAEIEQGLDPFGGQAFPTGVIASVALRGDAQALVVEGSLEVGQQTAYLATGSYGLAVVDISDFDNPIVLGQLDLPRNTTDVSVDAALGLAVLSGGSELYLVDVSDPMQPRLVETLPVSAERVEVADGLAYVSASGGQISLIDLRTRDVIDQHTYPGGEIDDMAVSNGSLYVVTAAGSGLVPHTIVKVRLAEFAALSDATATLEINGHPRFGRFNVTAGDGLIYVASPDESNSRQIPGIEVIRDEGDALVLIGPSKGITAFDVALNGSGLGVFTGANPGGPGAADVALLDLSDPTDTGRFLGSFPTPGGAADIAIASGLAYVAENGSLLVVNYLPFDSGGMAPTVSISSSALDLDPATPGTQVIEGSTISIETEVRDDVQVRNVELVVNGRVVRNDVSFPFELVAPALSAPGGPARANFQFRATDTGGNTVLSDLLTLDLIPDTGEPRVTRIEPPDGTTLDASTRSVRLSFSESLDPATVTPENFRLLDSADNPVSLTDLSLRSDDRIVQLTFAPLPGGEHRVVIRSAGVTDRTGVAMGAADFVNRFTTQATLQIDATAADMDANTPGIQVLEGSIVPVRADFPANPAVFGELVINDVVVRNDLLLRSNFTFVAPLITSGTADLRVRLGGRDAQGRTIVSDTLTLELVDDVTPPTITQFTPANGGNARPDVRTAEIRFSEALDQASLNAANFRLVDSLGKSIPLTGLNFVGGSSDRRVQLGFGRLPQGDYQLVVRGPSVTDRAGNPLAQTDVISRFTNRLRIETSSADVDPNTPGIQVFEAATVQIRADFSTNPFLQNVELVFNDTVVRNDMMLPSNFSFDAPTLPPGPAVLNVRIAATDSAGQAVGSNTLTFHILDDTTPPAITRVTPSDGATLPPPVDTAEVSFTEPIAAAGVNSTNFRLEDQSGNSVPVTSVGILAGSNDRIVGLEFDSLPVGSYRLVIRAAGITDRVGNVLGTSDVSSTFAVREVIRWVSFTDGDWNDPNNWDKHRVPVPADNVLIAISSGTIVTVTGNVVVNGLILDSGTLSVADMFEVTGSFELSSSATLTGAGDVVLNGPSTWRAGEMVGSGRTLVNDTLRIGDDEFTTRLDGRTLDNAGTIIWDQDPTSALSLGFFGSNGAVWNNLPGSLLDMQVDESFFGCAAGDTPLVFNNAGTVRKSAGSGTTDVCMRLNNMGRVEVETGTLSIRTELLDSATSSGVFTVAAGATLSLGGTQTLTAASSVSGDGNVVFGGTVTVNGAYDVHGSTNIAAHPINGMSFGRSDVSFGPALTLSSGQARLAGDFERVAIETTNVAIGLFSGHHFGGSLAATGQARLAGTLNVSLVSGYVPVVGDTFPILTYASRVGQFATINGLDLGDGKLLVATYNATNLTLQVVSGSGLRLAGEAKPTLDGTEFLNASTLVPQLEQARSWWAAAGVERSQLDAISVRLADLPGNLLGFSSQNVIWLDYSAAGRGWHLASAESDGDLVPADRVDLLTVLGHELGHFFGLEHADTTDTLMSELLAPGVRHGLWADLVDELFTEE